MTTVLWQSALRCVLAVSVLGNVARAIDDMVVDGGNPRPTAAGQGGMVMVGNVVVARPQMRQPQYDLGGLFDQHVYGRLAGNGIFIVNGRIVPQGSSSGERAMAAVRERCEHRLEVLERICRLDARQVRLLELALESDLKRVASQIDAARAPYAGRTMAATPQGVDRQVLEEVRDRAAPCRVLLESLPGPESLQGSVMHDILTPEQADAFAAWLLDRRVCRWMAMVKTVLVQLDESGLGLSRAQAAALEASLVPEPPKLDVLRDGTIGNLDGRMAHFQMVLVTSRLGARRAQWEHLLDPRQQAMLAERIESAADPSQVEAMLVDQGILERGTAPTPDKESP